MFLATLIGTAGALAWRYDRGTSDEAIAEIVYKRLGYLKLDAGGVRRFAGDFVAQHDLPERRLRAITALWPIYRRLPMNWRTTWADRLNYAEEHICTKYLMSSDFFSNGADFAKPVNYIGFYDAVLRACGNPFRQMV